MGENMLRNDYYARKHRMNALIAKLANIAIVHS